jgi:8-oxo-dGTP pyrophosphatase MutT (NUDIX family)
MTKPFPVPAKPASTIMLIREDGGAPVEVLLLKRNSKLKFASSNWVFPGGKIEKEELRATKGNDLAAAMIAASRETREETSLQVKPADLTFFVHWTTPTNEPIRFATWFFFAKVQTKNVPFKIDGSEIIDSQWITPKDALNNLINGKMMMLPPTFMSMMRIANCLSFDSVAAELTKELPSFVLPVVKRHESKMICMYEGDAGYELGAPENSGARHRVEFNLKTPGIEFLYEGCDHVFPLSGGHH